MIGNKLTVVYLTKDRMDKKLEIFTLRTIVNKTSQSTENDWTNLTFVDLNVH